MNDGRVNFDGVSVFIGMPAYKPPPVPTVVSLLATQAACHFNGIRVNVAMPHGASVVTSARNHTAHLFLKSDYQYLFWIDSDMVWRPYDFLKTLAAAMMHGVARVPYPARQEPLIFDFDGLGFTCVSREVMEALAATKPTIFYGDHAPCKEIVSEGRRMSEVAKDAGADLEFLAEDTGFFHDIRELGFKTYLDPDIELGHIGEKIYRGSLRRDNPDHPILTGVPQDAERT